MSGTHLVERASGLVVPGELEQAPEPGRPGVPTAYDLDGRRRLVFTQEEQRLLDRTIKLLTSRGLGIIVACRERYDGKDACGHPMLNEQDAAGKGYGCKCTRIHFLAGSTRFGGYR